MRITKEEIRILKRAGHHNTLLTIVNVLSDHYVYNKREKTAEELKKLKQRIHNTKLFG